MPGPAVTEVVSNQADARHYRQSTLRERIVEHVFIGEALRRLWQLGVSEVEVLRSEFDAGGFDLVLTHQRIVRHIQFKCTLQDGKRAVVSSSLRLMERPSGCILWLVVTPSLEISSYRWFGNEPGAALPDITGFPVTKHSKGNAEGVKTQRLGHRNIALKHFVRLATMDEVLLRLFGTTLLPWIDQ